MDPNRPHRIESRHRLMPLLALAALTAVGLGIGTSTADAASVDLVWTATTGSGSPGTDTIQAAPGDQITLRVILNLEAGESVSLIGVSVEFDNDGANELDLVSVLEENHVASFTCVPFPDCLLNFGPELVNLDFGVESQLESQPGAGGHVYTFEMGTLDFGPSGPLDIPLATITFAVVAPISDGEDIVSGYLNPGFDGIFDNGGTPLAVTFGSARVDGEGGPTGAPLLAATKADTLLIDVDGDGRADPGDTLRYSVDVDNDGDAGALGVALLDFPDTNAPLISGSVTTTQGLVTTGNGAGDTAVAVDFGTIASNDGVTVTFDARVADALPAAVEQVANQARITSTGLSDLLTDDPDTPAIGDATATPVVSDAATCEEDLGTCTSDLGSCEADLTGCEAARATAETDLAGAEAALSDAQGELASCETALSEAQADLGACEADLATSESDRLQALSDLAASEALRAQLEVDLAATEAARALAETELAAAETRIASLEADLATCEERLGRCEEFEDEDDGDEDDEDEDDDDDRRPHKRRNGRSDFYRFLGWLSTWHD